MLIGPLQFSGRCFSPGVLFPPLVHLNFLLLHHHIANERLVCCWHFERRQAMPFTLIAAICSDRLFLLLFCCWCFCFWCCPGMICTVCNNAFSSCATISSSFLHRSWLWADGADKCCRAFTDKEFNKVILCFVYKRGRAKSSDYLLDLESLSLNAFLHIYYRACTCTHAQPTNKLVQHWETPQAVKNTLILMPSPASLHCLYS